MRFFAAAAAIAGIFGLSTVAFADETRTVAAGKTTMINHHESWHGECEQGPLATIDITKQPSHGKINVTIQMQKIEKNEIGGGDKCIGRSVKGVAVYYTPQNGFTGTDTFSYDRITADGHRYERTYTVTVK